METIRNEFNEMIDRNVMPLFEIEVLNIDTNEIEYITFDVTINSDEKTLEAIHVALTREEENSEFIAFQSIEIDDDVFSLDEHLQQLYDVCNEAINNSDFYLLEWDETMIND